MSIVWSVDAFLSVFAVALATIAEAIHDEKDELLMGEAFDPFRGSK